MKRLLDLVLGIVGMLGVALLLVAFCWAVGGCPESPDGRHRFEPQDTVTIHGFFGHCRLVENCVWCGRMRSRAF